MTPVTNKEVEDIMKSLKWKYSYGFCNISLKEAYPLF
jgi:hypothetical protein